MTTPAPTDAAPADHYLNAGHGLASWLLTKDHKRIAWLYFVSITSFFFLGGAAATLIRMELITPDGDLLSSDTFNQMFSLHGIVMVWFFLIPSIPTHVARGSRRGEGCSPRA